MKDLKDKLMENLKNTNKSKVILITLLIIGVSLFLGILAWIQTKLTLNDSNCARITKNNTEFPILRSLDVGDSDYKLRDYYIKSAYNCCASGNFKNDFVNICALQNCIKQGVRCLDFEIYSVKNEPVISVSSVDDFNIKETYNSIPFGLAMDTISNMAFSGSFTPCPGDPLIINLRIMSKNEPIYNKIANILYNSLEKRIIGNKYSYEFYGENLGGISIKEFLGKVIIVIDKKNDMFEKTELEEYVNIASNSIFMKQLKFDDVKFNPDINELTEFNKKNMSIVIPNLSSEPLNYSTPLALNYGCQMTALSFQNKDENLKMYNKLFEDDGHAFVLKPENLRYIPVTIPAAKPPPKAYSYAKRKIDLPFKSDLTI